MRKKKPREKLPRHYRKGFLIEMSRSTDLGRRLNSTFQSLVADSGGLERMTTGRMMLAERMAFLDEMLRMLEREMVTTDDDDERMTAFGRWTQGTNALVGLVKTMGFDRPLEDPIDALYSIPSDDEDEDGNGHPVRSPRTASQGRSHRSPCEEP